MSDRMTLSLSYDQLTHLAESAILKCELGGNDERARAEQEKASAILNFWYRTVRLGSKGGTHPDDIKKDWPRLHGLVYGSRRDIRT